MTDIIQDLPIDNAVEASIYGFAELLDQLIADEELIFTIPAADEERFRKGLSVAKNRLNKKMEEDGIASDARILSFEILASDMIDCIDMKVSLRSRQGARVLYIRKPSDF